MVRSTLILLIAVMTCLPSWVRATDERTILAVLPLKNVMQKSELDWMSEGFAETITSKLNYVRSLRLVERVQLGEIIREQELSLTDLTEDDATRVGRLLNVDFLVIGSFQKLDLGSSITLKINTRVVNVTTGEIDPGRAVSVNGPYAQVFEMQDDIAAKLARNLGVHIADDELMLMSRDETASVVAYELYNLARYEKNRDRKEELLRRALELDPAYAKAHLKLGSFYMTRVLSDQSLEPVAINHLTKALALDPRLAEGHYVLGEFYYRKVREGGLKNDIEDEFRRDGIYHLNQFITSKKNSEARYYTRKVDKARRMLKKL